MPTPIGDPYFLLEFDLAVFVLAYFFTFLFLFTLLPARRYASAGYRDRNVSVCPSVRHAPVLCQNEES